MTVLSALAAAQPRVRASLRAEQVPVITRCIDLDGDRRAELVLVDAQGNVGIYALHGEDVRQRATFALAEPDACLLACADVDGAPGAEVVVATRSGVHAYGLGDDGFAPARTLTERARLRLRTGRPLASSFARDLNGDGRADLVLPGVRDNEIWLRASTPELTFARALTVPSDADIEHIANPLGLHSTLASRVRVPPLATVDLNGDGRLDLRVRTGTRLGYRLQGDGGAFGALREVDLALFQDTTPRATVTLGATAALSDTTKLESRDLDGDRIPDYVVAHRRKVWVFLAGPNGPQFETARDVKAVADDVTATALVDLDADARADLLLLRVQLPSAAQLALALVGELDIDVHAVGYRNEGRAAGNLFAATPAWRRTVTLRVPPVLSLFERQEELAERLFAVVDKVRFAARGSFDALPGRDLVRSSDDGAVLELWQGSAGDDAGMQARSDQALSEVLFAGDDPVFTLDRLFVLLDSYLARERAATLPGSAPAATLATRARDQFTLVDLFAGDLDGDGRDEVVAAYRHSAGARTFDVIGFGQ
jgi:hypothetical protein